MSVHEVEPDPVVLPDWIQERRHAAEIPTATHAGVVELSARFSAQHPTATRTSPLRPIEQHVLLAWFAASMEARAAEIRELLADAELRAARRDSEAP